MVKKYNKYKKYKQKHKKKKNLLSLGKLHVQCSFKNTIISLTKRTGEVLKQWSTKSLKKTKFKKNTPYNIQLIVYKVNRYIQLKKIKRLNIYLKGDGFGRRFILRNLKKKKIKIRFVFNITTAPFNGCRIERMRRR